MTSSEVAIPDTGIVEGLEDLDGDDLVMPRLSINHKTATFVDNLSNQQNPTLDVVILGLVKARVLFDVDIDDNNKQPFCKSFDFETGIPDPKNPQRFPWEASGFDQEQFTQPDGSIALPCDKCPLKEWGSNPGPSKGPWCSEQHQLIVMMPTGDGGFSPAVLTLQRTGLKPSRQYLSGFQQRREPTFVAVTHLSLTAMKKGATDYAVPNFRRGDDTPDELRPFFAENYRSIRAFLRTPRDFQDAEEAAATPPADAPAPAAAALADDEMPF